MLGILHIGAEKTGTTTLQETFHENRAVLSGSGIYYPSTPGRKQHSQLAFYGMDEGRENIHTRDHPQFGSAHRAEWRKAFSTTFADEIASAATRHDQLLISTELFHSQLVSADEIARVKALLDNWCSEYRVIFYMRRQDQLAVSLYSTRLRTTGSRLAILPGDDRRLHYYDFRNLLDLWGSVFGKAALRPRVFEKARLHQQDLVADFLAAADLPALADALRVAPHRNSALSRDAQTFLYRFNENSDALPLDFSRRRRTTRIVSAFLEENCKGPPSLPSRSAARDFCDIYREGNDSIAGEFFSRDALFDDDFSMYPEQERAPDSLDANQIMELATKVIHHLSANSLWLDQARVDRLLATRKPAQALEVLASYLEERAPALAEHLRNLDKGFFGRRIGQ